MAAAFSKHELQYTHIDLLDFFSGFAAGLTNIALTFPLNKLIFRQMLHGVPVSQALSQLRKEGPFMLYRGILPPLFQKATSVSIMFGSYNYYSSLSVRAFPQTNSLLVKSCSAGLAGLSEATLTPFERVQTLLQDTRYNKKFTNTMHAVRYICRNHGLREFYRGCSMIVCRNSMSNVLFFAGREKAQELFPESQSIWSMYAMNFVSGGMIGAVLSTVFYPFNIVKTRMQIQLGGSFQKPSRVFCMIYNERGKRMSEIFRGVHLNYTRSILSWGIINASYELYKYLLTPPPDSPVR